MTSAVPAAFSVMTFPVRKSISALLCFYFSNVVKTERWNTVEICQTSAEQIQVHLNTLLFLLQPVFAVWPSLWVMWFKGLERTLKHAFTDLSPAVCHWVCEVVELVPPEELGLSVELQHRVSVISHIPNTHTVTCGGFHLTTGEGNSDLHLYRMRELKSVLKKSNFVTMFLWLRQHSCGSAVKYLRPTKA